MHAPPRSLADEIRMTKLVFGASLLLSTVLLSVLVIAQPTRFHAAALAGSVLVCSAGLLLEYGRRFRPAPALLLVAALNIVFVPAEAVLRLARFRYESGIQFGYPRPYQFAPFEPHARLFWTFPPSAPGINRFGFREREVEVPKPAGRVRILFIGNSCT